ncbi:MAG: glycerophosphodiester phosphodiesterase family protein [Thermonemataceae bacterium]
MTAPRFITLIIISSLLFTVSCKTNSPQRTNTLSSVQSLTYPLSKPLVSAHRGAKYLAGYPENCLETFQYIRKQMNGLIECDVAKTKDGVLVLMHDKTVDRTTSGTGKIDELTYETVRRLQLKNFQGKVTPYRVPLFKEVLQWAKTSNTLLTVDMKRSVTASEVIDLIKESKAEKQCVVITYSTTQSQEVYQLAPDLMQSVSIRNEEELARWRASGVPAEKTIAFTGTRASDAALYKALHQEKVLCIIGTMGNLDKKAKAKGAQVYHSLLREGADIIATDYPLEVEKLLSAQ